MKSGFKNKTVKAQNKERPVIFPVFVSSKLKYPIII